MSEDVVSELRTQRPPKSALSSLRNARRRARLNQLLAFDIFYRIYVGVWILMLGTATWLGARQGESPVPLDAQVGGDILGVTFAIVVMAGIRSGIRGGPLALDRTDIHWILLSPLERRIAIGPMARSLARNAAILGGVFGTGLGFIAWVNFRGSMLPWIALGLVIGQALAFGTIGVAMIVSGLRLNRIAGHLSWVFLAVLASSDLLFQTTVSPSAWLAKAALWLVAPSPLALAGVGVFMTAGFIGLRFAPGLSLEAAARRSTLGFQVRVILGSRDIREAVLLRRYLAEERQRQTPWIPLKPNHNARGAFWRRGVRSLNRWPPGPIVRVLFLSGLAAWACASAWSGSLMWLIVAAAALFFVGLEMIEPLGQEVDNPTMMRTFPFSKGAIVLRHLQLPLALMILTFGTGLVVVAATGFLPWSVAMAAAVSGSVGGVVGSTLSLVLVPPPLFKPSDFSLLPEAALVPILIRQLWRPAVVVLSLLPIILSKAAEGQQLTTSWVAWFGAGIALIVLTGILWWVRQEAWVSNQVQRFWEQFSRSQERIISFLLSLSRHFTRRR